MQHNFKRLFEFSKGIQNSEGKSIMCSVHNIRFFFQGKYVLKKAPMPPMDGELDFCEVVSGLNDPQIGNVAKMYNMPSKCPIPPVS